MNKKEIIIIEASYCEKCYYDTKEKCGLKGKCELKSNEIYKLKVLFYLERKRF